MATAHSGLEGPIALVIYEQGPVAIGLAVEFSCLSLTLCAHGWLRWRDNVACWNGVDCEQAGHLLNVRASGYLMERKNAADGPTVREVGSCQLGKSSAFLDLRSREKDGKSWNEEGELGNSKAVIGAKRLLEGSEGVQMEAVITVRQEINYQRYTVRRSLDWGLEEQLWVLRRARGRIPSLWLSDRFMSGRIERSETPEPISEASWRISVSWPSCNPSWGLPKKEFQSSCCQLPTRRSWRVMTPRDRLPMPGEQREITAKWLRLKVSNLTGR